MVSYLVKEELTSAIRIVDKVPPQVAWLNKIHQEYLNDPIVEFRSANLINPGYSDKFKINKYRIIAFF